MFDTLNAKAALFAIENTFDKRGQRLPVMISGTITDASGRTLSGQTAEAFYYSLRHVKPVSFGLNCALGPDLLRQYVQDISDIAECAVSAHPTPGCRMNSASTIWKGMKWPCISVNGQNPAF